MYGFTFNELLNLQLGNPFTIYIFDDNLQIVSSNSWVFPILYKEDIVGVIESSYDAVTARYQVILPVPHVAQTGNCGVAAWAAVLNYRFSRSYSNATLATAMFNQGYISSTTATPTMQSYANYANANYSAGASVTSGVPSSTTVINSIGNSRPIMGNWESPNPSGSGKDNHAIIIVGYFSAAGNMTYTLKNPWYNYTQVISANVSNPVYSDAGYTWTIVNYAR
jgi:hypothetical protein